MSGVIKNGNKGARVAKRGGVVAKKAPLNGKNKAQQKGDKKVVKKPLTAEELDRALDSYMMKDLYSTIIG